MDDSHPWASGMGKSNVYPAMHGCNAITEDPNNYHVTGFGTILPHLVPGPGGSGRKVAGQVEGATGDGASPGFKSGGASLVFIDPEDPATGEGARGTIDQSKISARDIEFVVSQNISTEEKMIKLGQVSQEKQPSYHNSGSSENLEPAILSGLSEPDSPNIFITSAPGRDAVFEQALRAPVSGAASYQPQGLPMEQPGIPSALFAVLEQQASMLRLLQEKNGFAEKKRSDFESCEIHENNKGNYRSDSMGYDHIGLPWVTDPPGPPKVTVVFSFGRMTHKARFHNVSTRQCGTSTCVFLAIDERWDGSMTFPDPSDEPFRLTVPEQKLDLMVYDAGLRLDCGGKLSFIILLAADDQIDN